MERLKSWVNGLMHSGPRASHRRYDASETKLHTDDSHQAKSEEAAMSSLSKPDGGYGWLIVFASFMVHVVIYGVSWTVGVFNVIFLEEFGQSKTSTACVGSIQNALMMGSGVLSSSLVQRYGCRPVVICGGVIAAVGIALSSLADRLLVLYFTFSLLGGVGLGLAYIPSVVAVSEYFEQRRTIALGLAVSGVGFGSLVFPPVISALMEVYNWRIVMLVIAAVVFFTLTIFGSLMKPVGGKASRALQKRNAAIGYLAELRSNFEILKSVPFLTLCANNFLYCFGLVIVYVHLGALTISSGLFSKANSAMIFSIIGASNLVGRVLHGVVCHFPRMTIILVYMVSSLGSGVATLLMPVATSATALAVCAAVFGFSSSCLGVLLPDIIIRLVGDHRLGVGYGFLLIFESAGSMLGGPVAGLLFDYTNMYDYSFYLCGVLLIAAALVMVVPWQYTGACRAGQPAEAAPQETVQLTVPAEETSDRPRQHEKTCPEAPADHTPLTV